MSQLFPGDDPNRLYFNQVLGFAQLYAQHRTDGRIVYQEWSVLLIIRQFGAPHGRVVQSLGGWESPHMVGHYAASLSFDDALQLCKRVKGGED